MHTYSEAFQEKIIKKALSNKTKLKDLAQAVGISYATLSDNGSPMKAVTMLITHKG